jgi:putative NADH-flavin reductase
MRVAVIGITGQVGSRVGSELLRRGHSVLGLARDVTGVTPQANLVLVTVDANAPEQIAGLIAGNDAVVSATRFRTSDPEALLEGVRASHVPRLMVVGGAASLLLPSGQRLIESPDFPAAAREEAGAGISFLAVLQKEQKVDWTFLSPSAMFAPGERTTHFRLGKDELLVDAKGKSWISMEDFAIALVDELERPAHHRQRFTVGY